MHTFFFSEIMFCNKIEFNNRNDHILRLEYAKDIIKNYEYSDLKKFKIGIDKGISRPYS